jgi:hypothetical protein
VQSHHDVTHCDGSIECSNNEIHYCLPSIGELYLPAKTTVPEKAEYFVKSQGVSLRLWSLKLILALSMSLTLLAAAIFHATLEQAQPT